MIFSQQLEGGDLGEGPVLLGDLAFEFPDSLAGLRLRPGALPPRRGPGRLLSEGLLSGGLPLDEGCLVKPLIPQESR